MLKHKFFQRIIAVAILIAGLLAFSVTADATETVASGDCGEEELGSNLVWTLDSDGVLTISGTGNMDYWGSRLDENDNMVVVDTPWYDYREQITSVVIEEGVTDVGANAFYNCINLENVSLPSSLFYIRECAFSFCNIQTITIPSNVISIGEMVFQQCNNLSNITVESGNADYKDIDGVLYSADGKVLVAYPAAKNGNSYVILEGVREVARGAFLGAQLETVTIPKSVESVGTNAFANLNTGSKIYAPNSALFSSEIGNGNFNYNAFTTTLIGTPYTLALYDTDGMTVVDTISDVAYDEEISLPAGYNWAVNNELVTTYTKGETAENAVSLTAVNTYIVTFEDWNGTVLDTQTVAKGGAATAPIDPHRDGHTFTGWDVAFDTITADTTVTAQYSINKYKVLFVDWDGIPIDIQYDIEHGSAATAPADPTREGYTFTGWNKDFSNITEDYFTVTARYEINTYTVTFEDYNGAVLDTQSVTYGSSATAPADPTRNGYSFIGWDKAFDNITADTTVTAQYEEIAAPVPTVYTIRFLNYNRSTISSTTYLWGAMPIAPAQGDILIPVSDYPENYEWVFSGWDSEITAVNGNKTYVATFEMQYKQYNITFADYDGSVISSAQYSYGDAVEAPEAPTRASDGVNTYEFAGWDSEVTTVDGDKTYTATYTATPIPVAPVPPAVDESTPEPQPPVVIRPLYTVKFVDWDGSIVFEGEYHYGDKIKLPVNPKRPADDVFEYAFCGWDRVPDNPCKGNATYTAQYFEEYRNYTISFVDENGVVLSERTDYHWGDAVEAPEAPTRETTNTTVYTFNGWDSAVVPCDGDKVYVATYTETDRLYVIRFEDYNGGVISETSYRYGEEVGIPNNPTRESDSANTYSFAAWSPEVVATVEGEATYTATYTATPIPADEPDEGDNEHHGDGEEPIVEPTPPVDNNDDVVVAPTATPEVTETPAPSETPAVDEPIVEPIPPVDNNDDVVVAPTATPTPEAPLREENESNVLMYVSLAVIGAVAMGGGCYAARFILRNKQDRF